MSGKFQGKNEERKVKRIMSPVKCPNGMEEERHLKYLETPSIAQDAKAWSSTLSGTAHNNNNNNNFDGVQFPLF